MLGAQADLPVGTHDSAFCVEDHLLLYPDASANSLMVWNMDSQQPVGQLEGHDARITAVAARGSLAVSFQATGSPRLWNLQSMQCTATLPDVPDIWSTFCMEGRVLLGASGLIKLWDVAASAPVALPDLAGHTGLVHCMKASASVVLSGSGDKTVRLWDLRTGKCVRTMEGHSEVVCSVDMDGHCRTAVSGGDDETVRLWDLGSGQCTETYLGRSGSVRDVAMHESGSSFLSSSYGDYIVNAWVVGSTRAMMTVDFEDCCLPESSSRLFASRDLSRVAYCCISNEDKLELRYWK